MKTFFIILLFGIVIYSAKSQTFISETKIDSLREVYIKDNHLSYNSENKFVVVFVFDCKAADTILFSISKIADSVLLKFVNANYFVKIREDYSLVRDNGCICGDTQPTDFIQKLDFKISTYIQKNLLSTSGLTQGTFPMIIYSYNNNHILKEWSGLDDDLPYKYHRLDTFDIEYMQTLEKK